VQRTGIFRSNNKAHILSIPNNKGAKVSAKIFVQLFIGQFYPPTKSHNTVKCHHSGSGFIFSSPLEHPSSPPKLPRLLEANNFDALEGDAATQIRVSMVRIQFLVVRRREATPPLVAPRSRSSCSSVRPGSVPGEAPEDPVPRTPPSKI
jgi:hypothetical protein